MIALANSFIAFSGGVESTTLCLLFGGKAKAIFADTGDEHEEMYERIEYLTNRLRAIYTSKRPGLMSASLFRKKRRAKLGEGLVGSLILLRLCLPSDLEPRPSVWSLF